MAKDLLLEIGVEELPSGYMRGIIAELNNSASKMLDDARIACGAVNIYATPRRLVIYIKDVAEKQKNSLIENRGPKKNIAFDENGEPTKATLGFARGQGVEISDLEIRDVGGVEYLFASKTEKGALTFEVLPELLSKLITNINFPKSMRWAYYQLRFARPIRWILALYGEQVPPFSIENIDSSNYTYGHRFLSNGALEVKDTAEYFTILANNYVILDQDKRSAMIKEQVASVAAKAGGVPMENLDLLEEVTYLVEYPTAFYGEFSPSYLQVPVEVLTTSMIEHQRYFPVFDAQGKLLNGFIGIRNGTDASIELVQAGNERVLKARLEDALFFWDEDTKTPLARLGEKLADVLFHEKLGSIADKVKRLEKLTLFIGAEYKLSDEEKLRAAVNLCKADLVSNMVYEFPELQGIMGRYYALKGGEDEEVANAIFEHYLPRFAGDALPQTNTGIVLSLAEKLDNIVGSFAIGIKPTGSHDPYALRRQAIGLVNIILGAKLELNLPDILHYAYHALPADNLTNDSNNTVSEVYDFILQRLKGLLLERGLSHDVIDAVLAIPNNNINEIVAKIGFLQDFKASNYFEDFMVVFNRANNLSKKWSSVLIEEKHLIDVSEIKLYKAFISEKNKVVNLFATGEYEAGLVLLANLRTNIDEFFDSVMVMVEDENLKAARLSLLKAIANLCLQVADFNKIIV